MIALMIAGCRLPSAFCRAEPALYCDAPLIRHSAKLVMVLKINGDESY